MQESNYSIIARNYALDVTEGRIVSGRSMILACERYLKDLEDPDIYIKHKKMVLLERLCSVLHHWMGSAANKTVALEPWEVFIAVNIFGLYRHSTGVRKHSQSYV